MRVRTEIWALVAWLGLGVGSGVRVRVRTEIWALVAWLGVGVGSGVRVGVGLVGCGYSGWCSRAVSVCVCSLLSG